MGTSAAKPFTERTTREALGRACAVVGLDPAGAELMRMGANALFRLTSAPVVARVGRSVEDSRKEANVERWLESRRSGSRHSAG